jgi:hypothetical protein
MCGNASGINESRRKHEVFACLSQTAARSTKLFVVPANAGTHTPWPMLQEKKDNGQRVKQLPPVAMGPGSRPGRQQL